MRYKRTEVCQACDQLKNVCLLDELLLAVTCNHKPGEQYRRLAVHLGLKFISLRGEVSSCAPSP